MHLKLSLYALDRYVKKMRSKFEARTHIIKSLLILKDFSKFLNSETQTFLLTNKQKVC